MESERPTVELFRAVPRHRLPAALAWTGRQNGKRIPGNFPYVVDNVWEFLRPDTMPSRRHAIYASPTPELALENAIADDRQDGYVACHVRIRGDYKIAQLQVNDARHHHDVKAITRLLQKHSSELTECSFESKQQIAPLFLPGITGVELQACLLQSPVLTRLFEQITSASVFWGSASNAIASYSGELFFELNEKAEYRLDPV